MNLIATMPRGKRKVTSAEKNIRFEDLTVEQKITACVLYSAFKITQDVRLKESVEQLGVSTQTATKCMKDGLKFLKEGFEGDRISVKVTSTQQTKYDSELIKKNSAALLTLISEKDSVQVKGDRDVADKEESSDADEEPEPDQDEKPEPDWLKAMDDLVGRAKKCKRNDHRQLLNLRQELDQLVKLADTSNLGFDRAALIYFYADRTRLDQIEVGKFFGFKQDKKDGGFDYRSLDDSDLEEKAGAQN